MSSSTSPSSQFLCWLKELDIVYRDCEGVIQGDCGMCAGSENSGTQTNTIAFNPGTNQVTTVVDGIASTTTLLFDTGDITLAGALTVNSVVYPIGTSLHTVLTAMVAFSHPAATLGVGNNSALTLNVSTQSLVLDLGAAGSYDNSISGLVADNIQDAIDEVNLAASGLPSGTVGQILMHDGTNFVPVEEVREEFTGLTGAVINLTNPPLSFPPTPLELYRNGQLVDSPGDFTRVGQIITLTASALSWEIFTAKYFN